MDEQNSRVDELGSAEMVRPGVDDLPEARTQEIRAEIEQTREDISETVSAIQDRLRPPTLASNAADSVKRAAADTVRDVADSDSVMYIRANPIPTALIGAGIAGLAWLAMRSDRAWDRSFRAARAPNARDYGSHPSPRRTPPDYAAPAQNQLVRIWNESPLLIGAGLAVLGAIVAGAIPDTAPERQLMGATRDHLIDTVQDTVRHGMQDAASNVLGIAQSSDSSTQRN